MSFRVRLWCRYCTQRNYAGWHMGCLKGGTELLDNGKEFATLDEAIAAGNEAKEGTPWEFEVVDEHDIPHERTE